MKLGVLCLGVGLTIVSASAGPVEDWVELSANPESMQEWLDDLRERPLDINTAKEEEIAALPLLDVETARQMIEARGAAGGFKSVSQALSVPFLSNAQRESIEMFTMVAAPGPERSSFRASHQTVRRDSRSRMRLDVHTFETTRGFVYATRSSGESDLSAGLEFKPTTSPLRLVMGDFQMETGTGLVFASAYGLANWLSSSASTVPSVARGVRLAPTGDGLSRFRGAALGSRSRALRVTLVGSVQRLDALRSDSNVTRITEGETAAGELSQARADQIEESLAGADVGVHLRAMEIGGSAIHSRFSSTIVPVLSPTSVALFAGNELNVGSCYIQGQAGRLSVLGEVAKSNPGGYAQQFVLAARGELLDVSIYSVYAAQNYHSLHSKVWGGFGEEANNSGQTGGRFGVKWPGEMLNVQAWSSQDPFRTSRFPLARDAGGVGIRSDTEFGPMLTTGLLVQREWREETELDRTSVRQINRARIEATVHSRYEFKVRLEMKTSKGEQVQRSSIGTLLFAQVKGQVRKVSYFVRVTLFNAEDNTVALRAYENTPVGLPSVAVLSGSGRRLALVASRDLGVITGSIKVAHTVSEHPDRETFVDAALQLSCGW